MPEFQPNWKPVSRRSFIKQSAKLSLGLLAAMTLTGTYSYKIERFWYQIKEVSLRVKNLPPAFHGWKIVQFSDVHLGFHYRIEDFKKVANLINDLNPDIIFFTGDLMQMGTQIPIHATPLLHELKAHRGGKWAVIGNHDFYTREGVTDILHKADFKVLNNNHESVEYNNQSLYIAGIDDMIYGKPDLATAVNGLTNSECVLLLAHEPDIADESSKYPISVQFSGHSHGGQVCLPVYGPIFKQDYGKKYVNGFYKVGSSGMSLYVNRGIGTTRLAVRFFCRPEITVFRLNN